MRKLKIIYLLEENVDSEWSFDMMFDPIGYTENLLLAQEWCRGYNKSIRRFRIVEESE